MTRLPALGLAVALGVLPGVARATNPALDDQVQALAARLRCPVCQNLSVADSPSEMARQMRDVIRTRLRQGERPEAIEAYLVERYGEWILLVPPARGFSLLVWLAPFAALAGGVVGAVLILKRWVRRSAATTAEVDPEYLEKVRRAVRDRRG